MGPPIEIGGIMLESIVTYHKLICEGKSERDDEHLFPTWMELILMLIN